MAAARTVPFVDYLILDEAPHLVANECAECGARYFDRRNACANCFGRKFAKVDVAREGEVVSFTIVSRAAPGVPVPFVAAVVDCGGTRVRGNIVGIEPDAAQVHLGMKVQLVAVPFGTDKLGVEAVGYGFAPVT